MSDPSGEAAEQLAERLLDEPGNLEELRRARGETCSREELRIWLIEGLSGGHLHVFRTKRAPPLFDEPSFETLHNLLPDSRKSSVESWIGVTVVDPRGMPLPALTLHLDGPALDRVHRATDEAWGEQSRSLAHR